MSCRTCTTSPSHFHPPPSPFCPFPRHAAAAVSCPTMRNISKTLAPARRPSHVTQARSQGPVTGASWLGLHHVSWGAGAESMSMYARSMRACLGRQRNATPCFLMGGGCELWVWVTQEKSGCRGLRETTERVLVQLGDVVGVFHVSSPTKRFGNVKLTTVLSREIHSSRGRESHRLRQKITSIERYRYRAIGQIRNGSTQITLPTCLQPYHLTISFAVGTQLLLIEPLTPTSLMYLQPAICQPDIDMRKLGNTTS